MTAIYIHTHIHDKKEQFTVVCRVNSRTVKIKTEPFWGAMQAYSNFGLTDSHDNSESFPDFLYRASKIKFPTFLNKEAKFSRLHSSLQQT